MLAPHRDQENLVHSHQVPPKQHQPKTPSARYPKTPKHGRYDENAPTALIGKSGIGAATRLGGNDKTMTKGHGAQQALVTPMGARSRAPLGNKTTNAKTRTGQAAGVKNIVKEFETAQGKLNTATKPKQKSVEVASIGFDVKSEHAGASEDDEPEYAPPRPKPLPYQSDCFPEGGLTFEGLKRENILNGFYSHFHNPVDENGVSRKEKEFDEEMKTVMAKAIERNERDADHLEWNVSDVPVTADQLRKKTTPATKPMLGQSTTGKKPVSKHQIPPTLSSRRAASALAMYSDNKKLNGHKSTLSTASVRKPFGSLLQGSKAAKNTASARADSTLPAAAEAASRTTIGYNKGRTASSMMHSRSQSAFVRPTAGTTVAPGSVNVRSDLTITPARIREAAKKNQTSHEESRPEFMSIFDDDDDDDELLPMGGSHGILEDDEEEFELKLDM